MKNIVVVGSQWGDEGKGKIVDWLSEQADVVVRFQGGHNAGHTLVIDGKVFKLRLLPSGIVREGKISILGNGVVIDPWALLNEIKEIKNNSLFVANSAKTYDEERKVATKVPVKDISINNLNEENIDKKNKKKIVKKFIYTIKVADFYFYDTATEMINRINKDTNNTDAKIKKISNKKYRVYLTF